MRRFSFLNFLAVSKVVKKHDKLSHLPLKATLSAFVSSQPFHTGVDLLNSFHAIRTISSELMATAHGVQPTAVEQRLCPLCTQPMHMSLVYERQLRLCPACVASAARGSIDNIELRCATAR